MTHTNPKTAEARTLLWSRMMIFTISQNWKINDSNIRKKRETEKNHIHLPNGKATFPAVSYILEELKVAL